MDKQNTSGVNVSIVGTDDQVVSAVAAVVSQSLQAAGFADVSTDSAYEQRTSLGDADTMLSAVLATRPHLLQVPVTVWYATHSYPQSPASDERDDVLAESAGDSLCAGLQEAPDSQAQALAEQT